MFEPPTQYCTRCKQWVALDRSQQACAQTYACECVARGCPLSTAFARRAAQSSPSVSTRDTAQVAG